MKEFDKTIIQFIQEQALFTPRSRILIACSGGVDSMVLLHFFTTYRQRFDVEIGAVHVDHMLRGEESVADGKLVKAFCDKWNVPFYGGRVPVPAIIEKEGGNVQAVCREGRYAFFTDVMQVHQYNILATAHHAEDQLETVLMQVTKGNQPLGMPVKRKIEDRLLIRPFLPTVKSALYAYAAEYDVVFNEDPSNASAAYMRNRYRQEVVPHILQENAVAAEKVVRMTTQLQEDETFFQGVVKEWIEENVTFTTEGFPSIEIGTFSRMPTALQRRAIPLLLGYLYPKQNTYVFYKSELVDQLLVHLNSNVGNVSIDLPLGFQLLREYDKFTFVSAKQREQQKTFCQLPEGVKVDWMKDTWLYWGLIEDVQSDLLRKAKEIMYFDMPEASLPFFVRTREEGDRLKLSGMSNAKRLSRLFIDEKVSQTLRNCLPVIVTQQGEICAVPGLRYGEAFSKNKLATSKYIFLKG